MSQVANSPRNTSLADSRAAPRIIIVDDEPYMCDVCSRTLQRGGYDVVAMTDPQAAVRTLRGGERFDLLLTDIKMPAMSGLDLAHIAREQDPTMAIIIMTGFATMDNLQQSVHRGIADFLSKPFELDQLRFAVDQALRKRALLQDNLRLKTLEQLLESSEALSASLELSEVAESLLRVSLRQSECRTGFLLLMEERTAPVKVVPAAAGGTLYEAGTTLALQAFEQQQTILSTEAPICKFGDADLHYALAVPLRAQGNVNAILLLCDDRPTTFRPGIQESVSLLANHAGAALRNASLYGELGQAYQHVQELDRLKSEFISIASHELRTPLSIVLGYTMMVRDRSENEQRVYLERVMDSAQRIKDIVDDMVSLRHLDTGDTDLANDQVVLQDLVSNAIEHIRPTADQHAQQISCDVPEQSIAFVSDYEKVLLVLGHLLANAVRFTPQGGKIEVRAALRPSGRLDSGGSRQIPKIEAVAQHPWVVVEIQDTGIGIPETEQPRIFDRFYQVANSLTRDHGGIGLGLALVRELVSLLGGTVWVKSEVGHGSVFAFALPYREIAASAQ